MTGATRADKAQRGGGGRFKRFLERLSSSEEELHSQELQQEADSTGCTRIAACGDRQIVRVTGTLRTVTLRPRAGVPTLEAELFDGSAPLDVVWLGRRAIAGIEPGRGLTAWGRISMNHGRPVMFNPKYELRPIGQE
ncbi:OB-fold nucleic acid binding domain-containing protein [Streptomyces sp. WMMB 322]|uniref:OB-fold nucleic acid binding domain-containing protein n=1 Tax=Streptomyces sp. WMMB 322 TaxID=1286821 RepID=UPI0006E2A646|nr:OB-fold nucleic acid binding domain-containing protein [Streptomyces sp. WMMB 322]SCK50310.1 ATP-dependent DNA helicase RecG [Streptomyces sp. WMMB 322]